MNIRELNPLAPKVCPSFWEEISHPFLWVTEADLPRLKHNATLPFWKPKFEAWRAELDACQRLRLSGSIVDFHRGDNTGALKAALCYVVDEKEHYGRLIGSFLSQVVSLYRKAPDWRQIMTSSGQGYGTGTHWGGLTNNHIVDPQVWLSTAHLYDVIYGKGFMEAEDETDFEAMMSQFYQLSCLHEEMHKMDNNRSVWLCAGGYVSSLFDRNREMADATRERLRGMMPRFLDTILEDGWHYEIGGYGPGTIAAMQVFARCIRGAEGIDFFQEKIDGVGFEEFYKAFTYGLIPGESLRIFCYRDRINHWESIAAGYLEYDIPELSWVLSRMPERDWVPMFRHWPQGFEFYTYKEPKALEAPTLRNSHFRKAGMAFLRSSWAEEASSLYFRYGFQGSSHGGGLDRLNVELTCNDETVIADPITGERSYEKNVVLVDGECQEQCSGKCLYESLDDSEPIQYVSALGGLGEWPKREFLNDPRAEINYWCTKHDECFPGKARMRRTVVQIMAGVYVIRDTLLALDDQEHEYEWLWHTFNQPELGGEPTKRLATYLPKKRYYSEGLSPYRTKVSQYPLAESALDCTGQKADLGMQWSVFGAEAPARIGVSRMPAKYAFDGSPETGDGLSLEMINRLHLKLLGKDVAMTTVFIPSVTSAPRTCEVISVADRSLDVCELKLLINGKAVSVIADEGKGDWKFQD